MPVLGYWTFGWGIEPDGQPFDRALELSSVRRRFADLTAEPNPLEDTVSLPALLLHGGRDAYPDAALIEFPQAGHDLLRMRGGAVTAIASGVGFAAASSRRSRSVSGYVSTDRAGACSSSTTAG